MQYEHLSPYLQMVVRSGENANKQTFAPSPPAYKKVASEEKKSESSEPNWNNQNIAGNLPKKKGDVVSDTAKNMWSWLNQGIHQNDKEQSWDGYGPLKDDPKFFYEGMQEDVQPGPWKDDYVVDQSTVKPRWQKWFEGGGFSPDPVNEGEAVAATSPDLTNIDPEAYKKSFDNAYAKEMAKANSEVPNDALANLLEDQAPGKPQLDLPGGGIDFKPLAALGDAWSGSGNVAGSIKSPMSNDERDLLRIKMEQDIAEKEADAQALKQRQAMAMEQAKLDREARKDLAMMNNQARKELALLKPQPKPKDLNDQQLFKRSEDKLYALAGDNGNIESVHYEILRDARYNAEKNGWPVGEAYAAILDMKMNPDKYKDKK